MQLLSLSQNEAYRSVLIAALVFLLPLTLEDSRTVAQVAGPEKVWETTLTVDSGWTSLRAAAINSKGDLFIAAISEGPPNGEPVAHRLLLWGVSGKGEVSFVTEIEKPKTDRLGNPVDALQAELLDIVSRSADELIVVAAFVDDRPWIVSYDGKGQLLKSNEVMLNGTRMSALKAIQAADDRLLLVGTSGLDFLAAMVDFDGSVLWKVRRGDELMDLWLDGTVAMSGSGHTVVGQSGMYDFLQRGPSKIVLATLDTQGAVDLKTEFKGRKPRITRVADRGYAIAYDLSTSLGRDVRVKMVGLDWSEIWDAPVYKADKEPSSFDIAAISGGDVVVVGGKQGRTVLVRIDRGGNRVWSYEDKTTFSGTELRLIAATDGGFFLIRTVYQIQGNDILGKRISVMKFAP